MEFPPPNPENGTSSIAKNVRIVRSFAGLAGFSNPLGSRRFTAPAPIDLGFASACYQASRVLPRKEVIQPHLPIRLPCYDFTPVIGLTFGGCLP